MNGHLIYNTKQSALLDDTLTYQYMHNTQFVLYHETLTMHCIHAT